ncbi:uncharacterized protein TrAFT101_008288 [Trichoderma asperellum]|uniref:Uncharacterized protein n=1 Tax=Trichoderma asperellum (strain ATCC 204424 / CBS 433.97 / NBRC 101777) TaxID=1042311 RepID=A0A2T3ZCU4_TRIA4|nr:hypothetical protein M441DRAFT_57314 [Trichoderma asperellum CBS 433.97]PTB42622.1 hypothetical protein M441DRAFT_57314 [Trichoderma asperellum CBS 433.97]UKZ93374.1 hypothetical protein TrAFT101_008288 [Trichoderma asperellum]
MAQAQNANDPAVRPVRLTIEACKNDDVSLMVLAISLASKPESRNTVQEVIQAGLNRSLRRTAPKILSYLLDHGADVGTVYAHMIGPSEEPGKPSLEMLEMLIAHGWDIDARHPRTSWPLLWSVLRYPDLVEWCLAQGASVYLPGDTPPRNANGVGETPRESLLVCAAKHATVATFELLRERGAPLERRALHEAAEFAAIYALPYGSAADPAHVALFRERVDMVRHLVDVVGLDVNSQEAWPGKCRGTPLYYIARRNNRKDAREVIWFLLDRGADPDLGSTMGDLQIESAIKDAEKHSNTRFLEAVQEWRDRQHDNVNTA